ncbi:MAG TPA: dienelactone hydrolase family protein [Rhizomicrobium sp.]|jgi:carboxymethylenebutenolidase|nr:dienelactone hydrolase family protein [Rhizomicrobium sp.]
MKQDPDALMMQSSVHMSRRIFAATSLVAGFTLAAGPVSADAIVTDANGLDAGEVKIPVSDGVIPGYRAKPAGKTGCPTVLVTQEIFGVHEHIRDICRRFAKLGYYAIAPSLYARYGDPGKYDMSTVSDLVTNIVAKVPDAEVMSDLDSTVKFASGDGGDTARLAIIGFCWGGRIVWLYAAHNPQLKAAVAFYGPLRGPTPVNPLRPLYPLDIAKDVKAPVLGLYGGQDQGIHVSDMEQMRANLAQAGKRDSRIEIFMDAGHGFFADYRSSYNAKDAQQGWKEALAWFAANGVK